MSELFAELGYQATPLGDLSLRRRHIRSLRRDVYEVKLGEHYLMSSLCTASEEALGSLGISAATKGAAELDVVVGGLGLGYTCAAVLAQAQVRSVLVVELFDAVIEWHRQGLVPLGRQLSCDPRCRLLQGDFFALAGSADGFDPHSPGRRHHAILLDIDHAPDMHLDPSNARFYSPVGLRQLHARLQPGGVLGIWSDQPPDEAFRLRLAQAIGSARAHPISFISPLLQEEYTQSVYLARS